MDNKIQATMPNKDSSVLLSVTRILRETIKTYHKNKKLILFITLFTILVHYVLSLANMETFQSLFIDVSMDMSMLFQTDPKSPNYPKLLLKLKEKTLLGLGLIVFLLLLIAGVSVFSTVATIYVSTMSSLGVELNIKELCLRIRKIWKRPVITSFYLSLMILGFSLVVLPIAFIPVLFVHDSVAITSFGVFLLIVISILNIYIAMVWVLSLVISVVENCYGLEALGAAEKLIRGRKLHGFVLTLVITLPASAIYLFYMVYMNQVKSISFKVILLAINSALATLFKIFSMMVYTVFYFECKNFQGEEVQVDDEDIGYSKLSSITLVDTTLP